MSFDMQNLLHILLATEGYYTAKDLGSKLNDCLINLAETAKQNLMRHLDFGMRCAKTICVAAGIIRRADQSLDESLALATALYKLLACKYPIEDREGLAAYISTAFVGPNRQSKSFVKNYTTCREASIVNSPWLSFWEAKEIRHGLMLMTSQESFAFGSSLATWLNALQV